MKMQNDPSEAAGEALPASRPSPPDMDGAFQNLAHSVALLNWFVTSSVSRERDASGRTVYQFSESDGDQMMALLLIADQWADGVMQEAGR